MKWTKKWPTTAGRYWFSGYSFGNARGTERREMCLVEVRRIVNGVVCVTNGHFLDRREGAVGWWMPADVPEAPDWDNGIAPTPTFHNCLHIDGTLLLVKGDQIIWRYEFSDEAIADYYATLEDYLCHARTRINQIKET